MQFAYRCLLLALIGAAAAKIPAELRGTQSIEDLYERLTIGPHAEKLQRGLPKQLNGSSLTKDNLRKWFTRKPGQITMPDPMPHSPPMHKPKNSSHILPDGISADAIVDAAELVWDIVKDDAASLNVNVNFATATPQGVSSWTSSALSGWEQQSWGPFSFTWTNGFNMDTCSLKYNFIWAYNGQLANGEGQYVGQATEDILDVSTVWGFTFDVGGGASSPLNVGTDTAPIGQIELKANAKCSDMFWAQELSTIVNLVGDGAGNYPPKGSKYEKMNVHTAPRMFV